MKRVMLDTSIYSDAMRGEDQAVAILSGAESILMSPIVIAELLSGFAGGKRARENRNQLRQFLAKDRVMVAALTEATSDFYAHIFNALKEAGTPIPTHDLWIGASCMEHGAMLATRDHHFQHIPGLYLLDQLTI